MDIQYDFRHLFFILEKKNLRQWSDKFFFLVIEQSSQKTEQCDHYCNDDHNRIDSLFGDDISRISQSKDRKIFEKISAFSNRGNDL